MSLTAKQRELLEYIDGYIKNTHGVAPSFDEMATALNLASKSGVHRIIRALESKSYIRRFPHRARALEVLRRPGEPITSVAPPDAARDAYKAALREIANTPAYGAAHMLRAVALRALELFP